MTVPLEQNHLNNSGFDSIACLCHDKQVSVLFNPTAAVQYHLNSAVGMYVAQSGDNKRNSFSALNTHTALFRYLAPNCLFVCSVWWSTQVFTTSPPAPSQ